MTKYEAEQLIGTINRLIADKQAPALGNNGRDLPKGFGVLHGPLSVPASRHDKPAAADPALGAAGEEALYQRFKRRLIDEAKTDPILVQLLLTQPEIHVGIEHRRVELTESNLKGRLAKLAARGFFDAPRIQADAARELKRTGAEAHSGRLSEAFAALVLDGVLTREDTGFRLAPGVKVTEKAIVA